MPQTIKIKILHPDAKLPYRGSQQAAGYDVSSIEETRIPTQECALIRTGLAIEIPESYYLKIVPRSSLARKKSLYMPHSVGILDSDYRGELAIPFFNNHHAETAIIEKHERIAQIILQKYEEMDFQVVESLSPTERGDKGFGSTGKI